jgi:hypothetical protein
MQDYALIADLSENQTPGCFILRCVLMVHDNMKMLLCKLGRPMNFRDMVAWQVPVMQVYQQRLMCMWNLLIFIRLQTANIHLFFKPNELWENLQFGCVALQGVKIQYNINTTLGVY